MDPNRNDRASSGNNVIHLLIARGNFEHLLEDIFFILNPASLLSCSLVCRDWSAFIERSVWRMRNGEKRLAHNWIHREPVQRRVQMDIKPDVMYVWMHVHKDVVALGSGREGPDLFDRRTGRFKKRLRNETPMFSFVQVCCVGRRYVVARKIGGGKYELCIYDASSDYELMPMKDPFVWKLGNDGYFSFEVKFASDDTILVPSEYAEGRGFEGVGCFRICEASLSYVRLWTVASVYSFMALRDGVMVLCRGGEGRVVLSAYGMTDGMTQHGETGFKVNKCEKVGRLDYSAPVCFVHVICMERSRICLCDLEQGVVLQQLEVGALIFQERVLCSASAGTLSFAGTDSSSFAIKLWVWNLSGLQCNEAGREGRVVKGFSPNLNRAKLFPNGFAFLPYDRNEIVYHDFWGKL